MKATMNIDDGRRTIAAVVDGSPYLATDTHPNFERIHAVLFEGEALDEGELVELFDTTREVARRFESLSERVKVAGGNVYFDGEAVHNALAQHIKRFLDEGLDFGPLVNFFERVAGNPNEHSRDQLYSWLERHNFAIMDDGRFIAYKGVTAPENVDGTTVYRSISRGRAISDNEMHDGQIPQSVGSIVEMPRGEVQFDPAVGCSVGLHAGTWSYASGFSRGAVLEVAVDPRDVVSVPTDCDHQKIRTCRYEVMDVTQVERESAYYGAYDEYDDEDWDAVFDDEDDEIQVGDVVRLLPGQEASVQAELGGRDLTVDHIVGDYLYLRGTLGGYLPHRFEKVARTAGGPGFGYGTYTPTW